MENSHENESREIIITPKFNIPKKIFLFETKAADSKNNLLNESLLNNSFISKKSIEFMKKIKYEHSTKINNISLVIFSDKKKEKIFSDFCEIIFFMFDKFANEKKKSEDVKIVIVLSDAKKLLPQKNGDVFLPENVNSGYAIPSRNFICIFRREECRKVLIHEIVHLLEMDKYSGSTKIIFDNFHCDSCIIEECFTELKAVIINSVYQSMKKKKSVKRILHDELLFSLFQCSKIYSHQNISLSGEFRKEKINQETNVTMYYIVKTYILYTIVVDKKFDLNTKNYEDLFSRINFQKIDKHIRAAHNFKNKIKKENILQTMRMTMYS